MEGQLNKGVLELCILQEVGRKRQYGYTVMKRLTAAFPDVNASTVYAILRRLLGDGRMEISEGEDEVGEEPRRKYYTLTQRGRENLEAGRKAWQATVNAVNSFGI